MKVTGCNVIINKRLQNLIKYMIAKTGGQVKGMSMGFKCKDGFLIITYDGWNEWTVLTCKGKLMDTMQPLDYFITKVEDMEW